MIFVCRTSFVSFKLSRLSKNKGEFQKEPMRITEFEVKTSKLPEAKENTNISLYLTCCEGRQSFLNWSHSEVKIKRVNPRLLRFFVKKLSSLMDRSGIELAYVVFLAPSCFVREQVWYHLNKDIICNWIWETLSVGKDPCSSYKKLTESDRERKFTQDKGKSDAADLKPKKWYRFTDDAGFKLANR